MTTYVAATGLDVLNRAQSELYEHLFSDAGGRCGTCDQAEPCPQRAELTAAILAYGTLPQRRPGQTKHGLRRLGGAR